MKSKIGSFSVLAIALLFGLSTLTFSQGEKKTTTSPNTKKTEQMTTKSDTSKVTKAEHKKHTKKSKTDTKTMTPEKK